jgi:molybdopterin molybdotransferase
MPPRGTATMTSATEADRLIAEHMPFWPTASVLIDDAVDRILAEPIVAERDIPAFDRVTMDGIAVAFAAFADGLREFEILGIQAAGAAASAIAHSRQCMRVMTGAVLPRGTDTVIPVERIDVTDGTARVRSDAHVTNGQFVHCQGTDRKRGTTVLEPGMRIGPPEMAVLASVGAATVATAYVPRVAVISTGDELVGVDGPIESYQIRSSNDYAVDAALRRHRCGEVSRLRLKDKPAELLEKISAAHEHNDVLVLSGGVSMGDFDFVPATLERLGVRLVFHRIEQKPGRPMWFGVSATTKPVFALPGNPVSALVCLTRYVVPALKAAMRSADRPMPVAQLARDVTDGPANWTYFVPATLAWRDDGAMIAAPRSINTSGDFSSLAGTDGIVELGPSAETRKAGSGVPFYSW